MGNYIHQVFDVMVRAFSVTMIAVAMFLKNWVLACLVIVLTPISLWISSKIAGASGKYYDEWFKKSGELTEIVEESFTNFATAKAYNLEEYTVQKHAVVNEQLRKAVSKANFTGSIVQPLIKFANAHGLYLHQPHWRMADRAPGRGRGDCGDHCAVCPAVCVSFGTDRLGVCEPDPCQSLRQAGVPDNGHGGRGAAGGNASGTLPGRGRL